VNLPRFEKAEELGLHVEADLADFVEEERAASGRADHALKGFLRAGERAAAVAKELRIEHVARNGIAVERNERLRLSRRCIVQHTREQLFARSRFAGHENGDAGRSKSAADVDQLKHPVSGEDHAELLSVP